MQCSSREFHESVLYPNHFCIGFEYEVVGPASMIGMTKTDVHIAASIPGYSAFGKVLNRVIHAPVVFQSSLVNQCGRRWIYLAPEQIGKCAFFLSPDHAKGLKFFCGQEQGDIFVQEAFIWRYEG